MNWTLIFALLTGLLCASYFILQARRREQPMIVEWEDSIRMETQAWEPGCLSAYTATGDPAQVEEKEELSLVPLHTESFDCEPVRANGWNVQEKLPPFTQAQFWFKLKQYDLAINILHTLLPQDTHPATWLLLLDAYLHSGRRMEYNCLRAQFMRRFNIALPHWEPKQAPVLCRKRLRDDSALAERLNHQMQIGQERKNYLHMLLTDTRKGSRQGFSFGIFCDLARLQVLASEGVNVCCRQQVEDSWWQVI